MYSSLLFCTIISSWYYCKDFLFYQLTNFKLICLLKWFAGKLIMKFNYATVAHASLQQVGSSHIELHWCENHVFFLPVNILMYVTLSHLRSKEFHRIHKPCIPHHRDTSKCTFRCILGKWLHFKRASHFHQSKPNLDVDEDPLLVL